VNATLFQAKTQNTEAVLLVHDCGHGNSHRDRGISKAQSTRIASVRRSVDRSQGRVRRGPDASPGRRHPRKPWRTFSTFPIRWALTQSSIPGVAFFEFQLKKLTPGSMSVTIFFGRRAVAGCRRRLKPAATMPPKCWHALFFDVFGPPSAPKGRRTRMAGHPPTAVWWEPA
jgi:hypothetical protein